VELVYSCRASEKTKINRENVKIGRRKKRKKEEEMIDKFDNNCIERKSIFMSVNILLETMESFYYIIFLIFYNIFTLNTSMINKNHA